MPLHQFGFLLYDRFSLPSSPLLPGRAAAKPPSYHRGEHATAACFGLRDGPDGVNRDALDHHGAPGASSSIATGESGPAPLPGGGKWPGMVRRRQPLSVVRTQTEPG